MQVPFTNPWSSRGFDGDQSGLAYLMWSEAPGWETGGARSSIFDVPHSDVYGGVMAERLFCDFLVAAKDGAPAPSPIESLVHVLDVVEAAKKSSRTRRTVKVRG